MMLFFRGDLTPVRRFDLTLARAATRRVPVFGLALTSLVLLPTTSQGQVPTARADQASLEETAAVAQAWAAFAQGDLGRAAAASESLRATYPRSLAALALAVEVDIARGGARVALDGYERWLNGRMLDDPFALRRIARAVLTEGLAEGGAVRLEALKALAADGDSSAQSALAEAVNNGGLAEAVALASNGNEAAVSRLVAALKTPVGNTIAIVAALVESKSRQAVDPLAALLQDQRPEHRAAAAEGLAKLNAREHIGRLRALLAEPNAPPDLRLAVAGALYRLDDNAGLEILQRALASPVAGMRLEAARVLSVRPDPSWTAVARDLTQDTDPMVRMRAAAIVAPIDPALARATLDRLMADSNMAVREEAGRAMAAQVADDPRAVKALMRAADSTVRVAAAGRMLEITR